jgi:glutamyl-tRNA synthetase
MAELQTLNAKTLHSLPLGDVAARLPAGVDEATWLAIRPNLTHLSDAEEWLAVVKGPIDAEVSAEDGDYLAEAAQIAATIDWAADPWHALTGALKETTGRKGKTLFMPLRKALTGREHGPDMAALLPLIGRERALERLTR